MKFEENIKEVQKDELLSKYTKVGIGGPAQYLYITENFERLLNAVIYARRCEIPVTVLGAGSNTLISNSGIKGLVIVNTKGNYKVVDDTVNVTYIVCDSGLSLQKLSLEMFKENFVGLEYFAGIPCSIGGAVYNNIHGVGKSFCEFVDWVEYLDEKNRVKKILNRQCQFGYDRSVFQKNHGVILRVCLKLKKGDGEVAKNNWDEIRKNKLKVQPQKSLGCVFKNFKDDVVEKYKFPTSSVGWYIENKLMMGGYRIGDAMISKTHHNFIENVGKASAKDYLKVIKDIQEKSQKEFKIQLELEIELLGF